MQIQAKWKQNDKTTEKKKKSKHIWKGVKRSIAYLLTPDESKKEKGCGLSLTWEVSMDGMCDASGSLQRDVVQKHGSLLYASPRAS